MKKLFTILLFLTVSTLFAQDRTFIHTTTAANISGHITYLDHPDLNGHPEAKVIIANRWEGEYNNHITSIWYTGSVWSIYNEDSTPMTINLKYNIYIADPANVIVHEATLANQGALDHITLIDDPRLNNNNPGHVAVMTRLYPGYNNHNYGFYYDTATDKRGIYEESGAAIPLGSQFNILITGTADASTLGHLTTSTNTSGNVTVIDDPALNGNPDACFVFSHYWGVYGASSEVEIDLVMGAWYNGSNWTIFLEEYTLDMPEGIAFDIIVAPRSSLATESSVLDANLEAYPNPTSDMVNIRTTTTIEKVLLFDMPGKQIAELNGTGNTIQIDLSLFQAGAYLAKVQSGSQVKTLKLIKQ